MDYKVRIGRKNCYDIENEIIYVGKAIIDSAEFYLRALNHEVLHHVVKKIAGISACIRLDDYFVSRIVDLTFQNASKLLEDRFLRRDIDYEERQYIDLYLWLEFENKINRINGDKYEK